MLISHTKKFIFLKTSKTASTSIEAYFKEYCYDGIIANEWKHYVQTDYYDHMSGNEIKKIIGDDVWNSYYKFTAIRNPYDKLISSFFFFESLVNPKNFNVNTVRQEFEEWLINIKNHWYSYALIDNDIIAIDNKLCVDDVIRYETLFDDLSRVCDKLEIGFNITSFPKIRVSNKPQWATPSFMYTDISRKIVTQLFGVELNYFNYKFPE